MSEPSNYRIKVRPPIVESLFFPGEREALIKAVNDNLACGGSRKGALAVLSPHAAWQYAGALMGKAFAAARRTGVETVIILSSVHRDHSDGIFLSESDYFSTPLGNVAVAKDIVSELSACSTKIYVDDTPHLEEHGIEVVLPFVQTLFPSACIVPILFGKTSAALSEIVAKALSCVCAERLDQTLFVISTNLSSNCKKEKSEKEAERFSSIIERGNGSELIRAYLAGEIGACGTVCAASLLSFFGDRVSIEPLSSPECFAEGEMAVFYRAYGFFPKE